jgi:hypothetical protein
MVLEAEVETTSTGGGSSYRRWPARRTMAGWAGWGLLVILLFLAAYRQARQIGVQSDGASDALQAWQMLHGNLLLHGWRVADVSYYTTELPLLMAIEAVRGLRTDVVAISSAVNYTLVVVFGALVAKGRASGREGIVRAVLAAGIMFAPSMAASGWLLNDPDHAATVLWLLFALLVIEWGGRRWYVPVLVGLILAWATVGDSLVEVIGAGPLMLVGVARAAPGLFQRQVRLRERWYELSLAAAGLLSVVVAAVVIRVIASAGGWVVLRAGKQFVQSSKLPANLAVEVQDFFALFSANFFGHKADTAVLPVLIHLAGVAVVALAIWITVRSLSRGFPRDGGDLVNDIVIVAIACNLVAYLLLYSAKTDQIREVSAVLALGAVLAGRVLGGPLVRNRLEPVLAVGILAYLLTMGPALTGPAGQPANQPLAKWLESQHLTNGIGGYWQANSVTLDSGMRVTVRPVKGGVGGRAIPDLWEIDLSQLAAAQNSANFLVLTSGSAAANPPITRAGATRQFGEPAHIYHYRNYTILVWNKNILSSL